MPDPEPPELSQRASQISGRNRSGGQECASGNELESHDVHDGSIGLKSRKNPSHCGPSSPDAVPGVASLSAWRLLTTLGVCTAKAAADLVGLHLQRWRIEDFFRVLKSGCRTEFLLFRISDRPAAEGDRGQRRHRTAHHGDGPARPPDARLRARDDVHRPQAELPDKLCRKSTAILTLPHMG